MVRDITPKKGRKPNSLKLNQWISPQFLENSKIRCNIQTPWFGRRIFFLRSAFPKNDRLLLFFKPVPHNRDVSPMFFTPVFRSGPVLHHLFQRVKLWQDIWPNATLTLPIGPWMAWNIRSLGLGNKVGLQKTTPTLSCEIMLLDGCCVSLKIQSPCQMMSKGCIVTSSERYLGSSTILRRWLDP